MHHQPRKKHRLDKNVYKEPLAATVTILTSKRHHAFVDQKTVHMCKNILKDLSDKHNWLVHIYCFMPDHFHMLVETKQDNDLLAFVRSFKQKTGYLYKNLTPDVRYATQDVRSKEPDVTLWQRSWVDHLIRDEKSFKDALYYILMNPVKDGLINDPFKYTSTGSLVYSDLRNALDL